MVKKKYLSFFLNCLSLREILTNIFKLDVEFISLNSKNNWLHRFFPKFFKIYKNYKGLVLKSKTLGYQPVLIHAFAFDSLIFCHMLCRDANLYNKNKFCLGRKTNFGRFLNIKTINKKNSNFLFFQSCSKNKFDFACKLQPKFLSLKKAIFHLNFKCIQKRNPSKIII